MVVGRSSSRLCTNGCSRNNINFFVFAERKSEPKQASRASGCPQSSGSLQWEQYRDYCYAFDMAFYNFSVYNVEEAKRICKKLSRFRLFMTLQLVIQVHYLQEIKPNNLKFYAGYTSALLFLWSLSLGNAIASFMFEHLRKILTKYCNMLQMIEHTGISR